MYTQTGCREKWEIGGVSSRIGEAEKRWAGYFPGPLAAAEFSAAISTPLVAALTA